MGLSCSWIGVKGRDQADVLAALDLVDTGVSVGELWCAYSMCWTPTDWLIIASTDFEFASPERIALMSAGGEAVGVQLEEHVMVSGIRVFTAGAEVWSLRHDPERGLDHAFVMGAAPGWVQPIIERLRAQLAAEGGEESEVDFVFDAPIEAGATLCGYRHDEPFAGEDDFPEFTELKLSEQAQHQRWLERTPTPRKFWAGLFRLFFR